MSAELPPHVTEIRIYPVKGEPGQALEQVDVEAGGLAGDRRKRAALHLVSVEEDVATHPRANLVVAAATAQLAAAVGQRFLVGGAEIYVTGKPSGCPGVYADVVEPGSIRVGDVLRLAPVRGADAAPGAGTVAGTVAGAGETAAPPA